MADRSKTKLLSVMRKNEGPETFSRLPISILPFCHSPDCYLECRSMLYHSKIECSLFMLRWKMDMLSYHVVSYYIHGSFHNVFDVCTKGRNLGGVKQKLTFCTISYVDVHTAHCSIDDNAGRRGCSKTTLTWQEFDGIFLKNCQDKHSCRNVLETCH